MTSFGLLWIFHLKKIQSDTFSQDNIMAYNSSSYYCSRDKSSFEVCLNSVIMSNSWCIVALTIVAVINLVSRYV